MRLNQQGTLHTIFRQTRQVGIATDLGRERGDIFENESSAGGGGATTSYISPTAMAKRRFTTASSPLIHVSVTSDQSEMITAFLCTRRNLN